VTWKRCLGGCGCQIYVKGKKRICASCQQRKNAKPEIQVIIQKGWQVRVIER
jgi:hypothetical protein